MKTLIIFQDGFTYLDVTSKAKEVFNSGLFDLFELDTDNQTESLIETTDELNAALKNGITIGIESGYLNLCIGIEDTRIDEKTLIYFPDDGISIESLESGSGEWKYSSPLRISVKQDRVFDDNNNLII